jgi:hypothetical protein
MSGKDFTATNFKKKLISDDGRRCKRQLKKTAGALPGDAQDFALIFFWKFETVNPFAKKCSRWTQFSVETFFSTGKISFKSYLTLTYRSSMVSRSWKRMFGVCHENSK